MEFFGERSEKKMIYGTGRMNLIHCALLGFLVAGGSASVSCGEDPPTAKAPPTLTNVNMDELQQTREDPEEYFNGDDHGGKRVRSTGPILNPQFGDSSPSAGNRPPARLGEDETPAHSYGESFAPTINGHPRGPRAEVFNKVINSSFPRVNGCFAARMHDLDPGENSLRVKIGVSNSGRVTQAEVVSGIDNAAVRSCVVDTLRSLQFPSYEGREIEQVVPFKFVSR